MKPAKRLLLMLILTLMWAPSFLFIKLAIADLPPMTVVSLRVSIAAVLLSSVMLWQGTRFPKEIQFWVRIGIMAVFSSLVPFCLFCYAEQSIDSALAAVMNGTTPMFTAVLAQLFVASDAMNRQKVLGVLLSCGGLLLLFAPKLMEGVDGTTMGMSAALVASICYSISHVYGKLYVSGLKPYVAPASQMVFSGVFLSPIAFFHDQVWILSIPSTTAIIGVCGLGLFGSALAFYLYYRLLDESGPTALSTVACFFPVVGMALGYLFLGESFSSTGLIAAGMILTGVVLVNEVWSFSFLLPKKKEVEE